MFLRTFRIAVLVTLLTAVLGAPEAYILNRMRAPWRGIFLLVILGPLLISVVARTLGWALLFGGNSGVVNKALMNLGLISAPLPFMFTETGVVVALAHVLMPFMVLSVWAALQQLDPQIENAAAVARRRPVDHPAPHRAAADHARHAVGRHHRVRARGQRLRDAGDHRRPAAQGGGDARLRRIPQHAQLAAGRGRRNAAAGRARCHHRRQQPPGRAPLRRGVPMSRNGPLALAFHALFVVFMLAPILIVCVVAFTPEGYLSFPTNGLSLRWFRAIARYPGVRHAPSGPALAGRRVLGDRARLLGAGGARHRPPRLPGPRGAHGAASCRR